MSTLYGLVRVARNPISCLFCTGFLAKMLLVFVMTGGLSSMGRLAEESFLDPFSNQIVVSIPYPGTPPDDSEESIVTNVDQHPLSVNKVRKVVAIAAERNLAVVSEAKIDDGAP